MERQMFTETKKVLALAALIALTGVAFVETTRSPAQADPMLVAGGAAGYAGQRIDAVFDVVALMPEVTPVSLPLAKKGDLLPIGCAGPFETDVAAECMDTAYEVASEEPPLVVETRRGTSSSILMRMYEFTLAGF
jgi:hypothetical protein